MTPKNAKAPPVKITIQECHALYRPVTTRDRLIIVFFAAALLASVGVRFVT